MSEVMLKLRQLGEEIVATGKVDGHGLEVLRQHLYSGGKIDRQGADFLVELHKRVRHHTPAFERFFYQGIKDHLLADGRISPEGATWVRQMLCTDGKIDDRERKLLHELRGEARQTSQEFEALFNEGMKQPQEQHTSG